MMASTINLLVLLRNILLGFLPTLNLEDTQASVVQYNIDEMLVEKAAQAVIYEGPGLWQINTLRRVQLLSLATC